MRRTILLLAYLLLGLGPAIADDEKEDAPKQPSAVTEAERAEALKKAGELNRRR